MNNNPYKEPPSPSLLSSYRNAVLNSSVETYEAEIPNASWLRVFISLGVVLLVEIIAQLIQIGRVLDTTLASYLLIISVISIPVGSFLYALITYGISKWFGGTGPTGIFGRDFLIHTYLLALITTPISVVQTLYSLVSPYVGVGRNTVATCISSILLLSLGVYALYLTRNVLQVSRRLPKPRATLMVVILFVVTLVVFFVIFMTILGAYLSSELSTRQLMESIFATPTPIR